MTKNDEENKAVSNIQLSDSTPVVDLSIQKGDKTLDCAQLLPVNNSPQIVEKDDIDVFLDELFF